MASYSLEDKIRIIRRVTEFGESKSFVASSEGCERHTIDNWIKQFNAFGEVGLTRAKRLGKYSDALKDELLDYRAEHHCSNAYLSKRFNVPVSTVKGWIKSIEPDDDHSIDNHCAPNDVDHIVAQLIKENQRLRMENEVLKKVEASIH